MSEIALDEESYRFSSYNNVIDICYDILGKAAEINAWEANKWQIFIKYDRLRWASKMLPWLLITTFVIVVIDTCEWVQQLSDNSLKASLYTNKFLIK